VGVGPCRRRSRTQALLSPAVGDASGQR
jgi:hypothetical protein